MAEVVILNRQGLGAKWSSAEKKGWCSKQTIKAILGPDEYTPDVYTTDVHNSLSWKSRVNASRSVQRRGFWLSWRIDWSGG